MKKSRAYKLFDYVGLNLYGYVGAVFVAVIVTFVLFAMLAAIPDQGRLGSIYEIMKHPYVMIVFSFLGGITGGYTYWKIDGKRLFSFQKLYR